MNGLLQLFILSKLVRWTVVLALLMCVSRGLMSDTNVPIYEQLDLDYETGDQTSVPDQCWWEGLVVGKVVYMIGEGLSEESIAASFAAANKTGLTPADIAFIERVISVLWAHESDIRRLEPADMHNSVTQACLLERLDLRSPQPSSFMSI